MSRQLACRGGSSSVSHHLACRRSHKATLNVHHCKMTPSVESSLFLHQGVILALFIRCFSIYISSCARLSVCDPPRQGQVATTSCKSESSIPFEACLFYLFSPVFRCIEKGREKCDHYWPFDTEPVYYGDIQVYQLII
jgi:hypothetical protein